MRGTRLIAARPCSALWCTKLNYGGLGDADVKYLRVLAKGQVARDPELQVGGSWAAPALLQRWTGILAVALQRANLAAIGCAVGDKGHVHRPRAATVLPYELCASRVGMVA